MGVKLYDNRQCILGEGPLWHPERKQLFWFDIVSKQLKSVADGQQLEWQFDEHVSAAGWIDRDTLLIASETGLYRFELASAQRTLIVALDADNPVTRSNDGRADPWGGFWIGTMGKKLEKSAGAIYRYYKGRIDCLYDNITVSNAICFSPDRHNAYFTDTPTRQIMRQKLGAEGWPTGSPEIFIDLRADELNPDGAVVDCEGCLWNAQWGASRIARYAKDGTFLEAVEVPASQTTCPAFGEDDLKTLFATSASEHLPSPGEEDGCTFAADVAVAGLAEYQVRLA